jgi:hypothetical protein
MRSPFPWYRHCHFRGADIASIFLIQGGKQRVWNVLFPEQKIKGSK